MGELIHNTDVIKELDELGIETLNKLPSEGVGICVIRSHGESDDMFEKIQQLGFEIVDLTCLDVKKVQNTAVDFVKDNYFLIILGKAQHPEVKAIYKNASKWANDNILIASDIETLKVNENKIKSAKKVGVVVQTTQTKEFLFEVIDYLSAITKFLTVANTICPSCTLRQEEAKNLAKNSDLMVVVGSKKSANTTHLAQLLQKITPTIHIENEYELDNFKDLIHKSNLIGVTAGASTPQNVIDKVIHKLERT